LATNRLRNRDPLRGVETSSGHEPAAQIEIHCVVSRDRGATDRLRNPDPLRGVGRSHGSGGRWLGL